ncbi:MAG: ABC transporter permease [Dehalococcoidia bacterium]|nr:ABC transporter permease [Dehalococcoidia bacterium]
MTRVFWAEISKLTQRRPLILATAAVLVAAFVVTAVVFLSAEPAEVGPGRQEGFTLEELGEAGGASRAFAAVMAVTGIFVLAVFTASWATEFSQGTFRTLLLKEPRRLALLAGKMAGMLTFAAVAMFVGLIVTWLVSLMMAPGQDVSTDAWFSLDAVAEAGATYASALFVVAAWAGFGMMLAVLLRSVPLGLGLGIAWAGPFENLTADAWDGAYRWYPGLLLRALAEGGTADVTWERALALLAGYLVVAVSAAALMFNRRDVAS